MSEQRVKCEFFSQLHNLSELLYSSNATLSKIIIIIAFENLMWYNIFVKVWFEGGALYGE